MTGAAAAGMSGLVIQYYSTDDLGERRLLKRLMSRAVEIDGDRREDQAIRIINQLGAALNRKTPTPAKHG